MARRSKFNDVLRETMLEYYRKGKTDKQVAEIIGVSERTINNWKGKHPSFFHALKASKQVADALVEASLFNRAIGFSHPEEKIFCSEGQVVRANTVKQYPPDTTAAIFWLKNRQPEVWREDKDKVVVNTYASLTDEQLEAKIQEELTKREKK